MDEMGERPGLEDRLRVAESLLRALLESVTPLQPLLDQAHKQISGALQDKTGWGREEELAALRREVGQLRDGMASRAIIERAKGILMQGHGITEPESFELLTAMSQRQKRKVRDVAADVASGALSAQLGAMRRSSGVPSTGGSERTRGQASAAPTPELDDVAGSR